MLKQYKAYILFFYIFAAAAMVLAAFFDLQLDIQLNAPENPVALWFRNTGEIPCRLICPLAGTVLFYTCDKLWQKAAGALIALGGSAYLGYYIGKYFFVDEYKTAFSLLWGVGFGVVALLAGSWIQIPESAKRPLRTLAVLGIAVMAIQLLTVEGLKYLWGRVRFRDLLAAGSYSDFTPWYHINGINGNKSFPSGHTAGAGMSFLIMLLPCAFDKWKNKKALCFWAPFVYTCTVAFTRLMMGAHYLSDVTIGAVISFSIVLLAIRQFEKQSRIKADQNRRRSKAGTA